MMTLIQAIKIGLLRIVKINKQAYLKNIKTGQTAPITAKQAEQLKTKSCNH